jgi:signal transduction histidine kinase
MMKKIKFEYKLTLGYLIIGGAWILFSDKLANSMTNDQRLLTMIHMFKGWFYVLITGLLFYFFLKKHLNRLRSTEKELEEHKSHLQELVEHKTANLDETLNELKHINEELNRKNDIINSQNDNLKETLQHLKETQAHLLESEKMASLGVLTAGIAHEINNPLNFIMGGHTGLEDYLKEAGIKNETVDILMDSIKTGVERSAAIVSGLSQFSRSDKDYEARCNINMIIENCLLMMNSQTRDRIQITRNFSEEPVQVSGNVGKLHQVFTNILLNACQAIENDGEVSITTKKAGGGVIIDITDTGKGIKPEDLPRVTEPFFTTREPGQGIGLGLSIAYSIIKEHKGKIEFESVDGRGTTVKVMLPLSRQL